MGLDNLIVKTKVYHIGAQEIDIKRRKLGKLLFNPLLLYT
jgi:hypothetical protein